LNVRLYPALSGTATDKPKSWNSSGAIPSCGLSAVHVTVSTRSVIFSPSSFTFGLANLAFDTFTVQPGTGSVDTVVKPGGNCTSTFVVDAPGRSVGTRTSKRVNPPAGTSPTLLLIQGQAISFLASDPLGATATWYWQVGFVVVGHVTALTLAHDRALALYDKARLAVRSQYWMLAIMVGFTSLALWLLSQANT
jgi:hypothetical protein